jgi:hypothetical protein
MLQNILTISTKQFSIALFLQIDAATFSKSDLNGTDVFHVTFIDWIPGIFSALGLLIINSIDKSRLSGDSFSYSGDGVAWKARVVLFMGFAAMAGGLAGGVTVCVLKYVVQGAEWPAMWFGVACVCANAGIMLRCVSFYLRRMRVMLTSVCPARLCFGSVRTWRTTIPTTWHCKADVRN